MAILFGAAAHERREGRLVSFNSAFLVQPDGSLGGRYDKIRLIPFAEYTPPHLPRTALADPGPEFSAGRDATIFRLNGVRFGVLTCYEAVFPDLAVGLARRGAQLLINLSDDVWFGTTPASSQHFSLVTLRAVETRLPLLRAANVGISAFVEPSGRIRWETSPFEVGVKIADVRLASGGLTFYARHGDVFAAACLLVSFCSLLLAVRTNQHRLVVYTATARTGGF